MREGVQEGVVGDPWRGYRDTASGVASVVAPVVAAASHSARAAIVLTGSDSCTTILAAQSHRPASCGGKILDYEHTPKGHQFDLNAGN
eukprot:gene6710-biopygen229